LLREPPSRPQMPLHATESPFGVARAARSDSQSEADVIWGRGEDLENVETLFSAEEMTERRRAKSRAPSSVRKQPEIFIFTFIILRSCSARLLVKGTSKSVRKAQRFVLVRLEPIEQVAGGPFLSAVRRPFALPRAPASCDDKRNRLARPANSGLRNL